MNTDASRKTENCKADSERERASQGSSDARFAFDVIGPPELPFADTRPLVQIRQHAPINRQCRQ